MPNLKELKTIAKTARDEAILLSLEEIAHLGTQTLELVFEVEMERDSESKARKRGFLNFFLLWCFFLSVAGFAQQCHSYFEDIDREQRQVYLECLESYSPCECSRAVHGYLPTECSRKMQKLEKE